MIWTVLRGIVNWYGLFCDPLENDRGLVGVSVHFDSQSQRAGCGSDRAAPEDIRGRHGARNWSELDGRSQLAGAAENPLR